LGKLSTHYLLFAEDLNVSLEFGRGESQENFIYLFIYLFIFQNAYKLTNNLNIGDMVGIWGVEPDMCEDCIETSCKPCIIWQ
jgi:hypothetical protein